MIPKLQFQAPKLALFASLSTLICCALPALLITLGADAVMAGLAANVPGLIWLTAHKGFLFGGAGVLLAIAAAAKWFTRNASRPIDPAQAKACMRMRRSGTHILGAAVIAYVSSRLFAFFAADFLL
ncbi:MAG: hypothetical protein HKN14_00690 [Marinicaulis sp.]|nr:hypothetical protein [Marinicaulis sp.]